MDASPPDTSSNSAFSLWMCKIHNEVSAGRALSLILVHHLTSGHPDLERLRLEMNSEESASFFKRFLSTNACVPSAALLPATDLFVPPSLSWPR